MKRINHYFTWLAAVGALAVGALSMTSCNDDIATDDLYTYKAEMLSDWLRNNEDFSEFAAIVERAGKMDLFSTYGTYTCFAPTNAAVREYLQSRGLSSVDQLSVEDCDTLACTAVLDRMYFTTELGEELAQAADDTDANVEKTAWLPPTPTASTRAAPSSTPCRTTPWRTVSCTPWTDSWPQRPRRCPCC